MRNPQNINIRYGSGVPVPLPPLTPLLYIVDTFKSRLLQMLLQFDKELDWKLDLTTGQNRQTATTIINNIHAVVANTGSGKVETKDINIEK